MKRWNDNADEGSSTAIVRDVAHASAIKFVCTVSHRINTIGTLKWFVCVVHSSNFIQLHVWREQMTRPKAGCDRITYKCMSDVDRHIGHCLRFRWERKNKILLPGANRFGDTYSFIIIIYSLTSGLTFQCFSFLASLIVGMVIRGFACNYIKSAKYEFVPNAAYMRIHIYDSIISAIACAQVIERGCTRTIKRHPSAEYMLFMAINNCRNM